MHPPNGLREMMDHTAHTEKVVAIGVTGGGEVMARSDFHQPGEVHGTEFPL
jgi:hypothetical protein